MGVEAVIATQVIDTTTVGRSLMTAVDAAAARTALSLGTLATQSGTFSGTSSGTNTGDQDLSGYLTSVAAAAAYQVILVSGTNIKTINGTSLLGSGDIAVSASPGGSSGQVQYNNAGAFGGAVAIVYAGSGTHVVVTAQASTTVPMAVQAATSQTANLQEWRNSAGTALTVVDEIGSIGIGVTNPSYPLDIAGSYGAATNTHQTVQRVVNTTSSSYGHAAIFANTNASNFDIVTRFTSAYATGTVAAFGALAMYRPVSGVGNGNGFHFSLDNSSAAETEYGGFAVVIDTNTAGAGYGAATLLATINGTTRVEIFRAGGSTQAGLLTIRAATIKGLIVKGFAAQSASLQEWQDNSGTALSAVAKNGAFKLVSLADSAAENSTLYYSTTQSKLVWKDAGGTVNVLY